MSSSIMSLYPEDIRPDTYEQLVSDPETAARRADYGVNLVQGLNDVPRAISGLVTLGQWQDTNPFVQANNFLQSKSDELKTKYTPTALDHLGLWGIREAPQLLAGRAIGAFANRIPTNPSGPVFYKQPTRFTNPAEVLWNAGAELGKGITDPNIETPDAFFNAAVNLAPLGVGSRLGKTALGVGGEMAEVDNSAEDGIEQLWGIMK